MWRTTKLKYEDLSLLLNENYWHVKRIIENYKKLVKEQKKIGRFEVSQKRKIITDKIVSKMDEFCWKNKNRPLTIREIKKGVWRNNRMNKPQWNSAIASVLKKKLSMSFRTLATRHPNTKQIDQEGLYCKSVLIQTLLTQKSISGIEFSWNCHIGDKSKDQTTKSGRKVSEKRRWRLISSL